ncbi:MAG: hypothetical protein J7J94_02435 [Thaumarchaeota archaeon]|nr:hypothetical protein [Nitrososphaerota archaeon]
MTRLTDVIKEALLEARRVLSEALSKNMIQVESKGGFGDLSRQFDILTEKAVISVVKKYLDKPYIISEEIGYLPQENPEYYVLVDPVDGSTNASHGLPFYASSIAISKSLSMKDVIAAGVIDHISGKIYLGDVENGVKINGAPPSLSDVKSLKDALIFLDLSGAKRSGEGKWWFMKIMENAKHTRFFAAANLEIAYILEEKADAFACTTPDLKVMDLCAPMYLVKWSGGHYSIIGGDETISLTEKKRLGVVVASTKELLDEILGLRDENIAKI